MPRANPYRPEYNYNDQPTASGAFLFIGIVAAIVLAAIVWASYVPQPNPQAGGLNMPSTSQPVTPATPRNTPPAG